jgi:uncharacterized caspase-like protein
MPHHALVIGVDSYRLPGASLKGAVRDALAMRAWLADPAGGNVPDAHIQLLLSRVDGVSPETTLPFRAAILDEILLAISSALARKAAPGDRFYFYFAGHGLTAPGDVDRDTILPSDFLPPTLFYKSLTVDSILEAFKASAFDVQFFFIDACRDVPFEGKFNPSHYSPQPDIKQKRPVEQFVYLATSQGSAARETGEEGSEQGAFTTALLRGLRGAGSAKKYNALEDAYEVTAASLLDYVVREVQRTVAAVEDPAEREMIQLPVLRGQRSTNPVLASFPRETVQPVHLQVTVKPPAARKESRILVLRDSPVTEVKPPVGASVSIPLSPMDYRLQVLASRYAAPERFYRLPLYEDLKQEIILKPVPAGAGVTVAGGIPSPDTRRVTGAVPAVRSKKGTIRLSGADSLALLEVLSESGETLASGFREITLRMADPGVYSVRMTLPAGQTVEQPVFLDPGEEESVHLEPPPVRASPAMRNVSRRARFTSRPDHTIEVSETLGLGPIAPTDMAEIVSLAAFVESFSPADLPAYRLRSLGLRAMRNLPPDGAAALHLIALSESGTRRVKAALGAQPPQPLKAVSTMKGLLELAFPLSGEFDWLSIQIDSSAPLHLPLPSVPDYLHTVLLYWNQRGELSLSRYLAPRRMDAARREALSRTRRRLDLAERFYRDGLMPHAARMLIPGNGFGPEKLVLGKWEDPVAGCLAGYLLLRLEPQGSPHLDTAAKALPKHFPQLADAHLIAGEMAHRQNRENDAGAAFGAAARSGCPLFAEGLELLVRRTGQGEQWARARFPVPLWSVLSEPRQRP